MTAHTGTTNEDTWADDLALVQRTLREDRSAGNEFVDRMVCIPRFLRHFEKKAGTPLGEHALADLQQEVAARVWRDRGKFSGSSRLESWVYGYAWRVFLETLGVDRDAGVRPTALDDNTYEQIDPSARVDEAVADHLDALTILDLVDGLPGKEREVIRSKLLEGVPFSEIARRRGEDINAVKTRYYRALERIRARLEAGDIDREERR